jgi:hypothetical protein
MAPQPTHAAAGLLAAVSALAALRKAEAQASRDWRAYEHVQDEIAITLTLTDAGRAARAPGATARSTHVFENAKLALTYMVEGGQHRDR